MGTTICLSDTSMKGGAGIPLEADMSLSFHKNNWGEDRDIKVLIPGSISICGIQGLLQIYRLTQAEIS